MIEAYINGAKAKSKNGEEQMCKITNILPDNSATWIWNFQTLTNGCGPALYMYEIALIKRNPIPNIGAYFQKNLWFR